MITEEKLKKVRDNVRELLRKYKEARNNYNFLVMQYWNEVNGLNLDIPIDVLRNITSALTISRECREVQNKEGLYRSDKQIQRLREQAEEEMRRIKGQQRLHNNNENNWFRMIGLSK